MRPRFDMTILGTASLLAIAMGGTSLAPAVVTETLEPPAMAGGWRSLDGTVNLDLKRDSTFDLSVAGRERESHGIFWLEGDALRLLDDTGLRTPATVTGDGLITMAGHELFPL